jgi:glyoxylase-like metal-dependent hydrolase (beta-lactamase superfamily II)
VSGDTLFCGSIGRTDFPGGNMGQMQTSLRKLSQLPPRTVVLPGHNALTTIADEKNRVFRYYC